MGIHTDDLAIWARQAIAEYCPVVGSLRCPDGKMRDTKIQFDVVGRDWFRTFRVTVEVIEQDDFQGDFQAGIEGQEDFADV